MSKYLVCSDIHGEIESFRTALLQELPLDGILIAGDLELSTSEVEGAIWGAVQETDPGASTSPPSYIVAGNNDGWTAPELPKKIITKLNHIEFDEVIDSVQLDSVVEPKYLTAQRILQYVRAMAESMDSNVETLYRLMNNRVEALEFLIRPKSRIIGIKLADMRIKANTLIAGIVRDDRLIVPGGQDFFKEGDSVIVVTTNLGFEDISDIVETE